jgi:hypothetical protein
MLAKLKSYPGRQLAIVRYSPDHTPFDDWVYNAADIDKSEVIWAREMDAPDMEELLRYFKDRTVWLVEPDCDPPKLSQYSRVRQSIPGLCPTQNSDSNSPRKRSGN